MTFEEEWIKSNRWKIAEAIQGCSDIAVLMKIAALLGMETEAGLQAEVASQDPEAGLSEADQALIRWIGARPNCRDRGSCLRHMECMYHGCPHGRASGYSH